MNQCNFIVFDTETSGTDPEQNHEIVQLAATAINCHDLTPHHAGEFHILLKPNHPECADPGAIQVIGKELWERAQREGIDQKEGLKSFVRYVESVNPTKKWNSKPILVAHNRSFDMNMIESWMLRYGIVKDTNIKTIPWSFMPFCTMQAMFALWENDPEVVNYKLDTLLGLMGRKRSGNTHDALEDVRETAHAFVRYMKFMRLCRSKMNIQH